MTFRCEVGFSIIISEGGYCTIVMLTQPWERGTTFWGTSLKGSLILKAFPRACPHKIPPVECEDPLAGAFLLSGARLERSISRKYNEYIK